MKLQHLRYFLAVMDTGSITQAADRLGVTQPTLSVALKRLEDEFGTSLFAADGRGIRPLPQARRLEQMLRPVVRALSQARRELTAEARPRLRLGIAQTLSDPWVSRLLTSYDGAVELVEGSVDEIESQVDTGSLLMALTALPTRGKLHSKVLLRERYALFVAPTHAFAGRRGIDISELDRHPFVLRQCCEYLGSGARLMKAAKVRVDVVAKARQEATAVALVAAGVGCTIAPRSWLRPGLEMLEIDGLALERSVGLIWKAKANDAAVNALARKLSARLSEFQMPRAAQQK